MSEGKSSNMGVLAAVGAVLLGAGIIIATKGRR
jgi:LPXTG-motif cell wall-anchored protein